MLKLMLSSFTLEGRRVHQPFAGGSPLARETEDEGRAEAVARRAFDDHFGKAELWRYDGDTGEEVLIESKSTPAHEKRPR